MADDRKSDPAPGSGETAGQAAGKPSATPPVGAPGLRREPPIIDAKATEVPAATAKPEAGKPEPAKPEPGKPEPGKPDFAKPAGKPEPSHVRPAAPGAAKPAAVSPPPARASGVSAGTAALLGGVAGAALAIAVSLLLNRGDPQLAGRLAALEQQIRAVPSVDSGALNKRLADLEAQAKAVAAQAAGAAEAAKAAGQAAADSSGLARQVQGLASAATQTADANRTAIAALPKPAAAPDLAPLVARLDAAEKALGAAQAAANDRIGKLEARPVVSLDKVDAQLQSVDARLEKGDARLGQLEQAASTLKPMQDRIALAEATAKETQAKLDARLASIETASVAATATVSKAAASIDERLVKADQALAQTGQQIARTDQSVAAANQTLAQTGERIGALETRVKSIDLKPLADRIAALDGRFAPVETRLAETTAAVEGATSRAAATQAQSQATRAAVAADAIMRALGAGRPYAPEVATLEGVGVKSDALAPLRPFAEKGAPTGAQLAADFAPLADNVAAAGAPKPAESSFGDRLLNAAGRIVKVRKIGDASATDATSLAGRIEDSLQRGDVADAMKAFTALPEASRAAAAGFGEKLTQRARADEAARALSRDAYAALAQPKN